MIDRKDMYRIVDSYDLGAARIGTVASHSALDICDGAVDEGFRTHVVCQKGREKTYDTYFRAQRDAAGTVTRGMVDEAVVLDRFADVLKEKQQRALIDNSVLFVPNRSFTSYCGAEAVEETFRVPLVGSRNLLATEERGSDNDYYALLEKAHMPYPEKIASPDDIDALVIVKLPHAVKTLERGFFTAASTKEYHEKAQALLRQGVITQDALDSARIERYVIGPVFNLDFFYSPLEKTMSKLELLGVDWRFETSLDGHVRLPAPQQMALNEAQLIPEYTVCGHNAATLRESLLEKAFELGEQYVAATQKHYAPGIIGAFCLQTCVDKDLNFYIYDVAPRIGGGTNVHMSVGHPYGNALWRTPMSSGRRTARLIRQAIEQDRIKEIIT